MKTCSGHPPVNPRRGEIVWELDGAPRILRLTLGALAELEVAYGVDGFAALAARLDDGHFGARDAIRLVTAGLRGAGEDVTEQTVATMTLEGGAPALVRLAVALITAAFGPAPESSEQ